MDLEICFCSSQPASTRENLEASPSSPCWTQIGVELAMGCCGMDTP